MTTPLAVGAVLFIAAVIGAIVLVMLQSHTPTIGDEGSGRLSAESDELSSASLGDELRAESAAGGSDWPPVTAAEAPPGSELTVHIIGQVRNPGLIELASGARVFDAIEAAGGATEHAVLHAVNLARYVADGEQILVPDAEQAAAGVVGGDVGGGAVGAPDAGGGTVDLNTATAAMLETLPGVGPALASRILDWRAANGRFTSVEQLLEISGIGNKTFASLRELVRV